MKRLTLSILLSVVTAAAIMCVLTPVARAENVVLAASLLPSREIPPIINADQFASGSVTITLDLTRDSANNITAARARFDALLSNFPQGEVVILAHIHEGGATVNGPIRVDTGINADVPVLLPNGVGAFTRGDIIVPPALAAQIVNNPAAFYFNVHTVINPGGAMRGQLIRQTAGATMLVPTLSPWGGLLMFLLLLAAAATFLSGRLRAPYAPLESSTPVAGASLLNARFDARLFVKVLISSEAVVTFLLIAMRYNVAASDVAGSLACGVVAAFIIHLLMLNAMRH